jgi:hypothetical protein
MRDCWPIVSAFPYLGNTYTLTFQALFEIFTALIGFWYNKDITCISRNLIKNMALPNTKQKYTVSSAPTGGYLVSSSLQEYRILPQLPPATAYAQP